MEQDLTAILEQQLRDIHSPEAIGIWPPAFGWWILTLLILSLLAWLVFSVYKNVQANRYKKLALKNLNAIETNWREQKNSEAYLCEINALLKRTLISSGAPIETTSATGEEWAYLLRTASKKPLNEKAVYALTQGLYQKKTELDIAEFGNAIRAWLKGHKRQINSAGKTHA